MRPAGQPPAYDFEIAAGTPELWNDHDRMQVVSWNRRTKQSFTDGPPATIDIDKFMLFLHLRPGRDGQPVSLVLDAPESRTGSWWCIPFRNFQESALPQETQGRWGNSANWVRAWHGTKLVPLYSILYDQQLNVGHRFLQNTRGIYVHKDDNMDKCLNYVHFVPLCNDGVFWATVLELRVDRSDRIPSAKLNTDQWIQEERSVRLAALWVCGRTREIMQSGYLVQRAWQPALEAPPQELLETK